MMYASPCMQPRPCCGSRSCIPRSGGYDCRCFRSIYKQQEVYQILHSMQTSRKTIAAVAS